MSKKIYLSPSSQINNIYATGNTNEQEQCNESQIMRKQHFKGVDLK